MQLWCSRVCNCSGREGNPNAAGLLCRGSTLPACVDRRRRTALHSPGSLESRGAVRVRMQADVGTKPAVTVAPMHLPRLPRRCACPLRSCLAWCGG